MTEMIFHTLLEWLVVAPVTLVALTIWFWAPAAVAYSVWCLAH